MKSTMIAAELHAFNLTMKQQVLAPSTYGQSCYQSWNLLRRCQHVQQKHILVRAYHALHSSQSC